MSGLLRLRMYVVVLALAVFPGVVFGQLIDPLPTPIPESNISITLTEEATGLTAPIWGTFAPGVEGRLFVADQSGILWAVNLLTPSPDDNSIFLDLRTRPLVDLSTCHERGLLGVAFHAQYTTPGSAGFGRLYTYTSELVSEVEPAHFSTLLDGQIVDHQSVIIEWQSANPADPNVPPVNPRVLLRIDQPQCENNAGGLSFGPDGMLYIALGDGGGADDQGIGHGEIGNGQDPGTILGAILRIDPTGPSPVNGRYVIPIDNPFVTDPTIPDELYAYGFQNPSRLSFDASPFNSLLYVSDAGQLIQEINIIVADGNYGWNLKEGTFTFDTNGDNPGVLSADAPNNPLGIIDPVAQYDQDEGIDVVGGFVYRSPLSTLLSGRYIFGDKGYAAGDVPQCAGRLFVLQEVFDFGTELANGLVRANDPFMRSAIAELGRGRFVGLCILGFGQNAAGEVYVLANRTGTPFPDASGIATGVVMKINAL